MKITHPLIHIAFNWAIELSSIVIFWVAFNYYGLMSAIFWSLVATVVVVLLSMIVQRRCPIFPLVMCILVVSFGSYSLITDEPTAFIFQHTIYYGAGGLILIIGLLNEKILLKPMFDNLFALTDRGWITLTRRWAILFLLLALGNEWVWRTMSESAWATYKMGMTFTIMLFGLWQFRVSRRERLPEASRWGFKVH